MTRVCWKPLTCLAALAAVGCGSTAARLEIRRADDGRRYVETFDRVFGQAKPLQAGPSLRAFDNHEIVLFAERGGDAGGFVHFVRIRTMWPYREGITHTMESQINAMVDYVLAGAEGSLLYQGLGIVHVTRAGDGFECFIKNVDLGLTGWTGRADDALGLCRLTGEFFAVDDRFEHDYYTRRFEPTIEHLRSPRTARPPAGP